MTIKELTQKTGLSSQAVYKKIKARGYDITALKSKETGHFTPEGERIIFPLFGIEQAPQEAQEGPENEVDNQVDNQVEKLKAEVERLKNEVEKLSTELSTIKEDRDFLRITLEREQHLQALTISKLPAPPLALPSGEKKGLRGWFARWRRKKEAENAD